MITEVSIIPLLAKWREGCDLLKAGHSILLHAPRYYGKRSLLRAMGEELSRSAGAAVVNITSRRITPVPTLDFASIWESVVAQMGFTSRSAVRDVHSFEEAFRALLEGSKRRIQVNLTGCGRGNEARHKALLGIFNNLLLEETRRQCNRLSVAAIDDYSLFHYNIAMAPESDLAYFEKLYCSTLSASDVCAVIRKTGAGKPDDDITVSTAAAIQEIAGGHFGLTANLIAFALNMISGESDPSKVSSMLRERAWSSNVIEGLSAALSQDPESLSETALEYVEPKNPEAFSARLHVLRELGILVREGPSSKLVLCRGVITDLVRETKGSAVHQLQRVGSIGTEAGPRVFAADKLDFDEDDFVVVCLSDLHCSADQYRFEISYRGGAINRGAASLASLLREDLEKLHLLGRVDLLILPGDIVGNGKSDEYDRAESLLLNLIAELELKIDNVVIVPGNHDVDWQPGKTAVLEPNGAVSKEAYYRFRRLLRKPDGEVEIAKVRSRSGRRTLLVIGFDSNVVEGPAAGGIGFVSSSAFNIAQRHIQTVRNDADDPYVWLVVHHHVFAASSAAVEAAEKKKVSVLANSAEFQAKAIGWSAELIVHGHEHQPSVTVARKWPVDEGDEFAPLIVVGAGSVSARRELLGEFSRNQYFIIYRRKNDVILRSRCMGDQGTSFVAHDDLIIPANKASTMKLRDSLEPMSP